MDKETLSNYGWIVILVLILAVMIALATPFGNFIAGAIKSTTAGFFSVNENALGAAGIVIPGQNFDDISSDETPVVTGCDTAAWNLNTEQFECLDLTDTTWNIAYYHISSVVPTKDDVANGAVLCAQDEDGTIVSLPITGIEMQSMFLEDGRCYADLFIIVPYDNYPVKFGNTECTIDAGVWVGYPITSLTINGYTGFPHSEHCGH